MDRPNDFEQETLHAVALAYRVRRQIGHSDYQAFVAAMRAYRHHHPDEPPDRAVVVVRRMIAAAVNTDPAWFWRRFRR